MSTQQFQQSESLITIHDLEHPRSITRHIRAGLTLAGAAATMLALGALSPAANADSDTVVLPDVPVFSGETIDSESLGIAPIFSGEAYEQNGTFTNLFGESIDTTAPYYSGDPMQVDVYQFPGVNPTLVAEQISDPGGAYSVEGPGIDGTFQGSTFSLIAAPSSGFYNFYEDTPFLGANSSQEVDNVSETWLVTASGLANNPIVDPSGVEFGIQYLDLPDASTPVDAINVIGSGGDILFSLPVTGDLLTMF